MCQSFSRETKEKKNRKSDISISNKKSPFLLNMPKTHSGQTVRHSTAKEKGGISKGEKELVSY